MRRRKLGLLAVSVWLACLAGCFTADSAEAWGAVLRGEPKITITTKGAIWNKTLVVHIKNVGSKPLFGVCVSTKSWKKRYVVAGALWPGETAKAGWLELPSGFKSGDTIQVGAEGYMPVEKVLP